jgi:hypothetical protein
MARHRIIQQPIAAPSPPIDELELDQDEIPAPEGRARRRAPTEARARRVEPVNGDNPTRGTVATAPDRNSIPIDHKTPLDRLRAAGVEPLLGVADWAAALGCGRRVVERMRSVGRIPRPDCHVGKMPRWYPSTLREWLRAEGES